MRAAVTRGITVGLALVFLQVALATFYWLPDPRPAALAAPTWELFGVVALVLAWTAARDELVVPRWPSSWLARHRVAIDRTLTIAITVVAALFVFLGFAQGFARREFGYDLLLAFHIDYVPALFKMMYDAESLPWFSLYVLILVLGATLAVLALYLSVQRLRRFAADRRSRIALAAAGAAVALVTLPTLGAAGSLTGEAYGQLHFALNVEEMLDREARELEVEVATLRRLSPLDDLDERPPIFVFVIESYGAVTFSEAPAFDAVRRFIAAEGQALAADGFAIRSRYLEAPVFGGSSWMANSSILCGAPIRDQKRYEGLFASSAKCAPDLFNRAGYFTAIAASNTTYLEDRYARVFPFDRYVFRDDFDYRGTRYGWSYIPDQFTIHFVDQNVVRPRAGEPILAYYQLSSSHHTWKHIPPYIEDWSAIDAHGELFGAQQGVTFDTRFIGGSSYPQAYARSIAYVMRVIGAYVRTLPDDALVIVLGDHQPRRPVAIMNRDAWLVPVHVLGRDRDVVERFGALGYSPGMTPPPPPDELEPDQPGIWDLFRHIFGALG